MDHFWKRVLYTKRKALNWRTEKFIFQKKTKKQIRRHHLFFETSSKDKTNCRWRKCFFSFCVNGRRVMFIFSLSLFALTFFFVSSPQRKQQNKVSPTELQQHTKPQSTAKAENNEKCASFFPLLMPFFMFFFQSLWVGVWVCVYREKIRKNGERTFISIFRSIMIDALSLSLFVSFQKCFCVFYVFCKDRERLKI